MKLYAFNVFGVITGSLIISFVVITWNSSAWHLLLGISNYFFTTTTVEGRIEKQAFLISFQSNRLELEIIPLFL